MQFLASKNQSFYCYFRLCKQLHCPHWAIVSNQLRVCELVLSIFCCALLFYSISFFQKLLFLEIAFFINCFFHKLLLEIDFLKLFQKLLFRNCYSTVSLFFRNCLTMFFLQASCIMASLLSFRFIQTDDKFPHISHVSSSKT